MKRMDWGFVTDEVAEDPCAAMRLVSDWGIRTVELRSFGGRQLRQSGLADPADADDTGGAP